MQHDGKTFGYQEIVDHPFVLETSFVKVKGPRGGDWTSRISVRNGGANATEPISLIWYVALHQKTNGHLETAKSFLNPLPIIKGTTSQLGDFAVNFDAVNGTIIHHSFLSTVVSSLQYIRENVSGRIHIATDKTTKEQILVLPGEQLQNNQGELLDANFVAVMITVEAPFTLDISYRRVNELKFDHNEISPNSLIGNAYGAALELKRAEFRSRFEKTFSLETKGYTTNEIQFAEAALSNMVGGIGYFFGSSQVQSDRTEAPVSNWKAPLYTAVPSRSFFPRGFLWDEGFHGLLIASWDIDIELDIMSHWFDLMNVEGWIPREQILGEEALVSIFVKFAFYLNTCQLQTDSF